MHEKDNILDLRNLFKQEDYELPRHEIKERIESTIGKLKELIVHETSELDLRFIIHDLETIAARVDPPKLKS